MAKIIVPIATGFEEIEAITIVDVLRRADYKVITCGVGSHSICGAHEIEIKCDEEIKNVLYADADAVILPGGIPGTTNLLESEEVNAIVKELNDNKKCVAAVCAAPWVLSAVGVLDGKNATSYPKFAEKLSTSNYLEKSVVCDGNVITSRGVGTALAFSLTIVEYLSGTEKAKELAEAMLVSWASDKH
jgi:protein deglycase